MTSAPGGTILVCPSCRARQAADSEVCRPCGSPLTRLCACGASVPLAAERCGVCDAANPVRRSASRPGRRRRRLVVAGAIAGAGVVAACAWTVIRHWRGPVARNPAADREALVAATRDTRTAAAAWDGLAKLDRREGIAPEIWTDEARRAVAIDPHRTDAWSILAEGEMRAGRGDRAIEAAESATRGAPDGSLVFRVYGELLLRCAAPDASRAVDVLRRGNLRDPRTRLLLAEAYLRVYGELPAGERPPEMETAMSAAAATLERTAASGAGRDPISAAWVALASGRPRRAVDEAEAAVKTLPPELAAVRAELELLRVRALCALDGCETADSALRNLLSSSPPWRVMCGIVELIACRVPQWDWDAWLEPALAEDRGGVAHGARAVLRLAAGRAQAAAADADAALALAPTEPAFALLAGDARRACADRAGALAAYRTAQRLAPADATGLIRRAFAVADPEGGAPADAAEIEAASRELDALAAQDGAAGARALAAAGALRFAALRDIDARALLDRAARACSYSSDAWLLVGDGWSASPFATDQAEAARAYDRARHLRPSDAAIACRQARASLRAGDAAAARRLCVDVLARGECGAARALSARALADLGMWREAAAELARIPAPGPTDEALVLLWIEASWRSGDADSAERLASTMGASLSADAAERIEALRRGVGPEGGGADGTSLAAATVRLQEGDAAGCTRIARARLATDAEDARAVVLLALALCESGDAGTPDELRSAADRAGARMTPRSRALVDACVSFAAGQFAVASRSFGIALPEFREDPCVRRLFAAALERSGRADLASAELRAAALSSTAPAALRRDVSERLRLAARDARDPAAAKALLLDARRMAPSSPEVLDDLCVVLVRAGDADGAADQAEVALRDGGVGEPWRTRLQYRAAHARLAAGEPERAAAILDALPAAERSTAQALTLRGLADLRAGRPDAAADALERAWRCDRDDDVALAAYVDAALRCARGDAARRVVDEALAAATAGRRAWTAIALAFGRCGRLDDARAIALRAHDAAPDDVGLARLAVALEARGGSGDAAVRMARRFVETVPAAARTRSRLLLAEALERVASAHEEARAEATAVLADPRATAEERLGAKALLAEVRLGAGDLAGAAELATAVLAEPDSAAVESRCRFVTGSAAFLSGDAAQAEKELTRCVEIGPDDASAANNLAWLLASRKEPRVAQRALELARRATTLAPSLPGYWDTRAVCASAASESAEAESCWRRSLAGFAGAGPAAVGARGATTVRFASFLVATHRSAEGRSLAEAALDLHAGAEVDADARRLLDANSGRDVTGVSSGRR